MYVKSKPTSRLEIRIMAFRIQVAGISIILARCLEDINTETWFSRLGGLDTRFTTLLCKRTVAKSEEVKTGCKSGRIFL
jgi:hypothetical protein